LRASAAKSGTDPKAVLPSSNPQANTRQWRNPPAPTPLQCTIDKAAAAAQQAALEQKPSQPYLPKKKKTPKISNLLQLTISSFFFFFFFFFFVLSLARKKKKRKKKGRTVFTPLNSKNLVPTKKTPRKTQKTPELFLLQNHEPKGRIVQQTSENRGHNTEVERSNNKSTIRERHSSRGGSEGRKEGRKHASKRGKKKMGTARHW